LDLVDQVVAELDVAAIEKKLLTQAQDSQAQSLAGSVANALGAGLSELATGKDAPTLYRATPLQLEALGDVVEQARSGRQVSLSGPRLESLTASLGWRFARLNAADRPVLTSLRTTADASDGQLLAEEAIEPVRQSVIGAQQIYDRAHARFASLTERIKAMAKAHAPGKEQWKVLEKRREAQAEMEAAQTVLKNAQDDFRKRADAAAAASFAGGSEAGEAPGVVVVASFKHKDGKQGGWQIPVRRVDHDVVSPAVAIPPSLEALSREPAWPALKDKSAAAAREHVRASVSWHLWGGRVGPLHVGGLSVLHVFPLLVLLLSFWLSKQCDRVHHVYNPFEHPGTKLHKLGTSHGKLDMALLIALVTLVVALDIWTLSRLDAEWWLALIFGAGAISYAALVAQSFSDVQDLRTNIVRTSFPPPLTSE
jgi:hypothetical protein